MIHMTFFWKIIISLNSITLSLWIGSLFYYIISVTSSVGLLDNIQKSSILLQNLKKLYQYNGINSLLTVLFQISLFIHLYIKKVINEVSYLTFLTIILMVILHFYSYSSIYQKAKRAIRPKANLYNKINNILKFICFLGIINITLINIILIHF